MIEQRTSRSFQYAHLLKLFGEKYSQSGVTYLLSLLGFAYKKPKLALDSADKQAQDEFIKFYLSFIERKLSEEIAFFADGVHPSA